MARPAKSLRERFDAKYVVDAKTGCWLWTARIEHNGYGYIREGGRGSAKLLAHRASYELHVGPIPDGLTIDHLCRTRHCVNPAHLEPVTMRENTLRGETVTAANAAKSHCDRGHPFGGLNLRISNGERVCRECRRIRQRERRQLARGAA